MKNGAFVLVRGRICDNIEHTDVHVCVCLCLCLCLCMERDICVYMYKCLMSVYERRERARTYTHMLHMCVPVIKLYIETAYTLD